MPFCPVCKAEYRQGFHTCSNCKAELVTALKHNVASQEDANKAEKWVFLAETPNENEATIIESYLQSNEISSLKKYKGNGEVLKIYTGFSSLGIELFVPQSQFQQAKDLLDNVSEPDHVLNEEVDWLEREKSDKSRRLRMIFLLACFCIPLLVFLLMKLYIK